MGKSVAVFLAVAMIFAGSLAFAQANSASSERKVAIRVAPVYPELAKRMHIHGVVRVEAIVRGNGTVKSTRVLGGNPVLVDAAMDAVAKWKFETAQGESTEVVQLTFDSQ